MATGMATSPGLMAKLGYLAGLGVDAIWLSPDPPVAQPRLGLRRLRL